MKSFRSLLFSLILLSVAACGRPEPLTMFVGTYSDGFYAYEFDQDKGILASEVPLAKAEMTNPSYLAVHGNTVYAVSERSCSCVRISFNSWDCPFRRPGRSWWR